MLTRSRPILNRISRMSSGKPEQQSEPFVPMPLMKRKRQNRFRLSLREIKRKEINEDEWTQFFNVRYEKAMLKKSRRRVFGQTVLLYAASAVCLYIEMMIPSSVFFLLGVGITYSKRPKNRK